LAPVPRLLLALLLAAPADTLVVGTLADPVVLEPHRATDLVSIAVLGNVCEPLVRYRADGERPEPALATSWATRDNRTWTFTLRAGVRFHDGAPLDAEAVIVNFEHLQRERGFPGRAARIGPLAVELALDRPNAALLATLSQPYYTLQSPRALANANTPVGTGAFRFRSARPGLVELEASPDYWGGAPRIRYLLFRRYPSEAALTAALVAGEVDVTSSVGQARITELRGHPSLTLDSKTGLNLAYLALNNERPPFSDRRVRQAVARAIDRRSLIDANLGGHGEPARNPLPPSLLGYAAATKELRLDASAVQRLLADAGLPEGFGATMLAPETPRPYMPSPLPLAAQLRDQLALCLIRAPLQQVTSWPEYVDRLSRGEYEMAVIGWQADSVDPNDFLSALLGSESIGTTNRSRYRSPAMDTLLRKARMAHTHDERLLAYREAQDLFQKDMPFVPLYHVSVFTAYNRSVRGLLEGPTGLVRYDKAWKAQP
jgi:peptide/nickel transport system substrate-binding protein